MYENNIMIIGPSDSGKETVSNNVKWGKSKIKIASYASIVLNGHKNFLFMLKGEENYKSFEEVMSSFENGRGPDGIIVVMDNSQGFNKNNREIIDMIISRKIPHVIFANKQDIGNQLLNNQFNDSLIIPTIATEGIGISDGFKLLLKSIQPNIDTIDLSEKSVKIKFNPRKYNRHYNEDDIVGKMKDALKPSDNHDICKLKLSMHPVELDNVIKILKDKGFSNLTVIKTKIVDDSASKEIYRGFKYDKMLKIRVELVMIIKSDDVQYVVNAIESIKTDDIDDYITIKPIQEVLRLSTLEKGDIAID
jgi:signal recognition particle receptor subunit beta/nitrogen regulatory protein PII